ncbi:MAG: minichromosome maintenance protein MCM [Desulfurococcaceae archaeon]
MELSDLMQEKRQVKLEDASSRFKEFLENYKDSSNGRYVYRDLLEQMGTIGLRSLTIDFEDLLNYDQDLARMTVEYPDIAIEAASKAIKELLETNFPDLPKLIEKFYPRFRNIPRVLKIRDLSSEYIGKLIAIEGIVVRLTRVEAKLVKAFYIHVDSEDRHGFYYPEIGEVGERLERPVACPQCGRSGRLQLDVSKSKYMDWQKIAVQEKPEEIPPGQMPRSIEVVLTGDLVDRARPGDRATVVGILRVMPSSTAPKGIGSSVFNMYIDANYVDVQQRVLEEIEISRGDEEKIKELAKDPWIHEKIVLSIAPTIHGHYDVKKALALALFSGVPKLQRDGTRIRGDIHVLLVGDPGIGKSMLLQYVAMLAPRAVFTSGKGSTAAGLTAAVLRDKQTGEYYLEAGALVIADGGVAVIDEIDKMKPEDRVAIHEAMEQQTISIAKAGIVARLNARAAVIAAGNPKYGRYDPNRPIADNINLPPTILSRFDLIFVLKDIPSVETDSSLADHILRVHGVHEKVQAPISPDILRKYISYARRYVHPRLSPEVANLIKEFYVQMRLSGGITSPIPITARQLEALIRLAEAHAKMALRDEVTVEDVEESIRLMLTMLYSVGVDVETGAIDIDTLMIGKPRSQQEKLKLIMQVIDEKISESPTGAAKLSDIIQELSRRGLPKDLVENTIKRLKMDGELFEPKPGYISKVAA